MSASREVRITVDIAMFGLMIYLFSYPLSRGLLRHGICGIAFIILFVIHNGINLGWYRKLFVARWNFRRILIFATNISLLFCSVVLIISSVAMSGDVFSFIPFPMPSWSRNAHKIAAAWTFVLASCHLGLHGNRFWSFINRLLGGIRYVAALAILLTGVYAFMESGLWIDMLLLEEIKTFPVSIYAFMAQYICITMFFAVLTHLLLKSRLWYIDSTK